MNSARKNALGGGRVGRANAKPTGSMPVNHSRKIIETATPQRQVVKSAAEPTTSIPVSLPQNHRNCISSRVGSFAVFVRAVRCMVSVGFAFGSTHPTAPLSLC